MSVEAQTAKTGSIKTRPTRPIQCVTNMELKNLNKYGGGDFSVSRRTSNSGDGNSPPLRRQLMKFQFILSIFYQRNPNPPRSPLQFFLSITNRSFMATPVITQNPTLPTASKEENLDDDRLCSGISSVSLLEQEQQPQSSDPSVSLSSLGSPNGYLNGECRIERAWAHWKKLGEPKLIVAPMVDNSELPFRMLCRKYGAEAAYTPMLHSRIFSENEKYRTQEFTTCKEDRPLFVQFCANNPDTLLEAARIVGPHCDYVDINLGCPQRIARRGNYGAFLMDNLPLIKSLVEKLAQNLQVPVSCKIRIFPNLEDTITYARMLEDAGCALLAVHGRTRDEKDGSKFRADWTAIKAVKDALRIPVLANGNIRHMDDVRSCLEETGVDGVLSAESLLENPALFAGFRTAEWIESEEESNKDGGLDQGDLLVEYLKFCEKYPVPWRMIRAHVHRMLGDWFRRHPDVREDFNKQTKLTFEYLYDMVNRLRELGTRIPLYVKSTDAGLSADKIAAEAVREA